MLKLSSNDCVGVAAIEDDAIRAVMNKNRAVMAEQLVMILLSVSIGCLYFEYFEERERER
jgi:hypothetical protein